MKLNEYGEIIESVLKSLPKRFPIKIDIKQIMPNHIHIILIIANEYNKYLNFNKNIESGGSRQPAVPAPTLGFIVGLFKSESTKQIRKLLNNPKKQIFQRNFYERIIRNEREYKQIVYYIRNNPQNWKNDI